MAQGHVLVTGASGFIGRWALAEFADRGVEAVGVSRHPSPSKRVLACDLTDAAAVKRLVETVRPATILHLAWSTEHGAFWSSPANLDWAAATLHLARVAASVGTTRFVGVGTCFEYQHPDDGPCIEASTPIVPRTLYGVAKDATRRVLAEFGTFSFAWARLFYLYGPHEDARRLVPSVARRLAAGEPAPLSAGLAVRDFMDARDAGSALAALALSPVEGAVNVASGQGVSVREIAERLGRLSGTPDILRFGELPDRDEPPTIVADVTRLRDEVGWTPERDLNRGLAECYSWWNDRVAAHSRL